MKNPIYAAGIIYDPASNSALLQLRDGKTSVNPNKWGFLGGLIREHESPLDGFIREIQEEIGVSIKPEECKLLLQYFHPEQKTEAFIYYVEREQSKTSIKLTEGARVSWVPLPEVLKYDLTHWTRRVLMLVPYK